MKIEDPEGVGVVLLDRTYAKKKRLLTDLGEKEW